MKRRLISAAALLALAAGMWTLAGTAAGQRGGNGEPGPAVASSPDAGSGASAQENENLRLEGERRFHANCGRCHQAPHKFPPRMMATIVRHMRVRATITDADMRAILAYMTQ